MPSNIKYKKYTYKSSTKAPAFTAASPSVGGVRGGYFDAQLGRFWQVDALAELDYSTSVYAFANNNPVYFNDPWGLQTEDPNKANGFKKKYDGNVNNLPNASEGVTVTGTRKKGLPPPPPAGANATPPRPITMGDIASSSNEAANTGGNNGGGNGGGGMQTVYTEGALQQGGQGGGNEPASKAEFAKKGGSAKAGVLATSKVVKNEIDWDMVMIGAFTTSTGAVAAISGLATSPTGFGTPLGTAGLILGIPTMGFGIGTMVAGFQGGIQQVPGGLFEATDLGFGGNGTYGQIADLFSGGIPKSPIDRVFFAVGLYQSNVGKKLTSFNYSTPKNYLMPGSLRSDGTYVKKINLNR